MNMVRPSSITALDKKPPSRDTKLPLRSVAPFDHLFVEIVYLLDVLHLDQHINDGLGADAGDGGTADVMDGYNFLA